jgi:DegV family protein with EDD domain
VTVKIVTDSTSDLSSEAAKELGITVVSLYVYIGSDSYRDGIDLAAEEFYSKLQQNKELPTTSVPPVANFTEVYDKLAEEADGIVVITISHKLSATHDTALQAVELMKRKCQVEVIDSLTALMAQGLLVIAAAKAANAGASLDEVVAITRRNIPRAEVRMAFDTLEYLKKGGRIGKAQAFMGSMLKVHPILGVKDAEVHPFSRERCRAKAIDYLYNFATGFSHIEEMAVEDAATPDEADILVERLSAKFPKERIYRSKVGSVIGTHVGPHVLAVSVLGDRE